MNSPFAQIFLALRGRIQAQIPGISYIDQDLGQLKATRPPVTWPCVLIDFEDMQFSDLAAHIQMASGTVVFRLGFAPHSNTTQATPTLYLEKALNYYDIEWALHKVLHGWSPGDEFGNLTRTSTTTQKRTDSYRVREIRYAIAFQDNSTKLTQLYAPAQIVITEELV